MTRARRIIAVTAGLIATGAVAGALAGGVALTLSLLITPPWRLPTLGGVVNSLVLGGAFGAPLGGVAAPVLAWLLLRSVPLGKMFVVCAIGTMVGGMAGWFATMHGGDIILIPLMGAFAGCLLTALGLRLRARQV